ncbi:unnamed protein product [Mytilus coruscus]|uniref:Integrase catalytic domain-containing protein n=1 Tax=Mytilus coruscus TaxID=42192 RepID=A0A6J8AME6_MYTCO|nr:unnamed protein product [Mytilus coruscus]
MTSEKLPEWIADLTDKVSSDKDLRLWIQEQKPPDLKSLVELAEAYQTAHKNVGKGNDKQSSRFSEETTDLNQTKGHITPDCTLRNKPQFRVGDHKRGKIALCLDKRGQTGPCSTGDEYASDPVLDPSSGPCQAVQTRAQKIKQSEEEMRIEKNTEKYSDDLPLTEPFQIINSDSNFQMCTRQELIDAQKSDHTLDTIISYITDDSDEQSYFTIRSDILYRIFRTYSRKTISLIVDPQKFRKTVLTLECQRRVQKGRVSQHPMDEPFQRIAIDFVGPLPLTENKNKYVLVCMDYSARYLEAFPLANQEAATVAVTLIQLFSRVCIAKELSTDQGSNVMSDLMVQEEWEEPTNSDNSVLGYVLETTENLRQMTELARQNAKEAKQKKKTYYDKKSRTRNLKVGEKVLVLLPTHTSKLRASLKGPYVITDKISLVDYTIKMKGTTEKIFHINMLKLWYDRSDDLASSNSNVLACLDTISSLIVLMMK